jgi:NitT/TauT family transport system permease protein
VSDLIEAHEDLIPTAVVEPPSVLRWRTMLAVPLAAAFALGLHASIAKSEPQLEMHSYRLLFLEAIAVAILLALLRRFSPALRRWMANMWPVFTAAIVLLCVWDVITVGLRLLPLPYFPGPAAVLRSMINDRFVLLDSTWHSLVLLMTGYALGVIAGLISGICIGWSSSIRYWGMPILKVVGPIPATAWIPLALVLSRFLPGRCAHARRRTRLSYFPSCDSRGASKRFHRFVHGSGRVISHSGRR